MLTDVESLACSYHRNVVCGFKRQLEETKDFKFPLVPVSLVPLFTFISLLCSKAEKLCELCARSLKAEVSLTAWYKDMSHSATEMV